MITKLLTASAAVVLLASPAMGADATSQPGAETMQPSDPALAAQPMPAPGEGQGAVPVEEQADIAAMERSGSGQRILINQQPNELLTTEVIGSPVYNDSEEKVGDITALIVDDQQQSVVGGLVSVGGFLGIGAKEVGVSWDQLEPLPDRDGFRLAMTKEELTDAASYQTLDSQESEQEAAEAQQQLRQQPVAPAAPQ